LFICASLGSIVLSCQVLYAVRWSQIATGRSNGERKALERSWSGALVKTDAQTATRRQSCSLQRANCPRGLVEAMRWAQHGAGRLDGEDDSRQVASHLLPPSLSVAGAQLVDTRQQVDETRERRTRVRAERTRSEQQVPSTATPPLRHSLTSTTAICHA